MFALEFGVTTMILAGGGLLVGVALDYFAVSIPGVTQWWALLAAPALVFWLATLAITRFARGGSPWVAESDIAEHSWQSKASRT